MATELKDMKSDQATGSTDLARRAAHPIIGKTDLLSKRKDLLGLGIPGHMAVEREIRTATIMLAGSKKLQATSPQSFYTAVSIAINSGVGLGNGKGYLVPYKTTCSFVPGWKGLIDLVNRTGRASAWTGIVRRGDEFDYALGDSPFLKHKPGDSEDHKDITHYYAIGRVKGAEFPHIKVWTPKKVISHLNMYNKVGGEHYALKNDDNMEAYGQKVVLLQVLKFLPTSQELENALAANAAHDNGKEAKVDSTIDGNFVFLDDGDGEAAEQPGEAEPIPRTDRQSNVEEVQPSKNDIRREHAETVEVREEKPAAKAASPEASEAYEKVAAAIHKSLSLNQLADANEMIDTVDSASLRKELQAMYRTRMGELSAPATSAAKVEEKQPAPARRVRRSAGAAE